MPDLLATTWTTSGDSVPLPGRHASPLTLPERIEATAKAGFAGYGILDLDLEVYLRDGDMATLRAVLDDSGMAWRELEFLLDWWQDDALRVESDQNRRFLLQAAEALGADHVKIGPDIRLGADTSDLVPPDVDLWAERLHGLASEATEHGTSVAIEFLPYFSNVPDLASAFELVRRADHPAAGLCIDIWHVERSGTPMAAVAEVPAGLIKAVELNDATLDLVGEPYSDTVLRRRYLGEGEFRVVDFIRAIHTAGWHGPWGVEIISEAHRVRPLAESLPEVVSTTRQAFALAGVN